MKRTTSCILIIIVFCFALTGCLKKKADTPSIGLTDSIQESVSEHTPQSDEEKTESSALLNDSLGTTQHVLDYVGLLSTDEVNHLEILAGEISLYHNCGVYIGIIDDYTSQGFTSIEDCAEAFYKEHFGESTGLLLVLSMKDRDYDLDAFGSFAHYAFTDYGKTTVSDAFLASFGRDNWYDGFVQYLARCDIMLRLAVLGQPVDV